MPIIDHKFLNHKVQEDIEVLKSSNTMPVALPGCSFFLRIPYTPARKIIDAGFGKSHVFVFVDNMLVFQFNICYYLCIF